MCLDGVRAVPVPEGTPASVPPDACMRRSLDPAPDGASADTAEADASAPPPDASSPTPITAAEAAADPDVDAAADS